jgi:RNA polymerase sigma-70 factor (ECF subfamily)
MTTDAAAIGRLFGWLSPAKEADWDALYAEQLPRVYNYFRFRVGEGAVAEDLTSATFEKAWRARNRYRRDLAAFSTWMLVIARNVAADHFRRVRPHVPIEDAAGLAAGATPEDLAVHRSDVERLARLLTGLDDRARDMLALKYGAGLTNRAIARHTGLSESNVGTILHRSIQALRAGWPEGDS